jgi:hypothetical protein
VVISEAQTFLKKREAGQLERGKAPGQLTPFIIFIMSPLFFIARQTKIYPGWELAIRR